MARRGSGGFRDLLIAVAVVGGLLAAIFVYTGNWPPLVVIESESMMHCDRDDGWFRCPATDYGSTSVSYGRVGTIDPGDLVFVKSVDSLDDIEFWVDGVEPNGRPKPDADLHYGAPGDVIVYHRNGVEGGTPIIHRAMTYVTVVSGKGGEREYDVRWMNGVTLHFGVEGIYLPLLGLGDSARDGYKPPSSGIITKGDNPIRNAYADQHRDSVSRIVQVEWLVGKAQGEIPWLGLLKLMWGSEFNVRNPPTQWARVVNAWAPPDMWACLAASIAGLFLIPIGIDVVRLIREERERRRD
ncbi:MAG TPA: S26 family signal peptidase, partial [Candidatus Thermoplasmatota archaeon]|nr:S26 family signal peptidase [Candidatus Thermoplasmatota archaeon]